MEKKLCFCYEPVGKAKGRINRIAAEMREKVTTQFIVRESDLDVFGHVNNVSIFRFFENARWDFIAESGFGGTEQMQLTKKGPIVLEIKVEFRRELKPRELLYIETVWASFDRRLGIMAQSLLNSERKLACSAEVKLGLFDLEKRKLITPNDHWKMLLGVSKV